MGQSVHNLAALSWGDRHKIRQSTKW